MLTGKRFSGRGISAGGHDFCYALEKNIWILPVGMITFLMLIPFGTAGLPGDSIFNIEVTHDQMKFRLIHPQAIPLAAVASIGLGLAAGISLFRFVWNKRETTIFFSLGVARWRLYMNRALVGTLMLAGSVALPMGLSLWLNLQALGGYPGLVRNVAYLSAGIFVMGLFSFLAAAAAGFLAGTLSEALVYWAGFLGAPTVLCYSVNLLLKKLYWGNAWGVVAYTGGDQIRPSLLEQRACWNPALFFVEEMQRHAQFIRPLSTDAPDPVSWGKLAGWTAGAFFLFAAAGFILRHRKAEAAGIFGANRFLSEFVIGLTGFLVFSLVFSWLYDYSVAMAAALGMAGFYGVHIFWRRLLFSHGFRGNFLSAVLQTAPLLLICVIFQSGFCHGAERFLSSGEIREAKASYVGAPGFLGGEASGSASGRGYYIMSHLTAKEQGAIEKVKDLQRLFLDAGKMEKGPGGEAETVVPYDISFSYTDGKGREHIWYYDRASYGQLEQMLSLEEETEAKQERLSLFLKKINKGGWAQKAYETGEVFLSDRFFTGTFKLTLSEKRRRQLLSCMAEDLKRMNLQERYFPEKTAEAVLLFTGSGEADCQHYSYHLNNAFVYLTPDYENTLAWLRKNDLLSLLPEAPELECIYLQKMDLYIGIHEPKYPMGMYFMGYCADTADEFLIQKDFGKKYTLTDEAEMEETASGLQNGYYMSRGGYFAAVKIKGENKYRYLFLPAAKAPEGLR